MSPPTHTHTKRQTQTPYLSSLVLDLPLCTLLGHRPLPIHALVLLHLAPHETHGAEARQDLLPRHALARHPVLEHVARLLERRLAQVAHEHGHVGLELLVRLAAEVARHPLAAERVWWRHAEAHDGVQEGFALSK